MAVARVAKGSLQGREGPFRVQRAVEPALLQSEACKRGCSSGGGSRKCEERYVWVVKDGGEWGTDDEANREARAEAGGEGGGI